jgi:hypothetical protein
MSEYVFLEPKHVELFKTLKEVVMFDGKNTRF